MENPAIPMFKVIYGTFKDNFITLYDMKVGGCVAYSKHRDDISGLYGFHQLKWDFDRECYLANAFVPFSLDEYHKLMGYI